jgi:hypothetical protein
MPRLALDASGSIHVTAGEGVGVLRINANTTNARMFANKSGFGISAANFARIGRWFSYSLHAPIRGSSSLFNFSLYSIREKEFNIPHTKSPGFPTNKNAGHTGEPVAKPARRRPVFVFS